MTYDPALVAARLVRHYVDDAPAGTMTHAQRDDLRHAQRTLYRLSSLTEGEPSEQ
jgi:hypothetical protein